MGVGPPDGRDLFEVIPSRKMCVILCKENPPKFWRNESKFELLFRDCENSMNALVSS